MIRLFYIERNSYYINSAGCDQQVANGGTLPDLYTSKQKALQAAQRSCEYFENIYGYKVVIPNNENPAVKDNCIFAVRLYCEFTEIRLEIRVYEIYTH